MKKTTTIPSFTYEDTTHPNVKRFVDRDGEWTHYWLVKEKRFVKGVTHVLALGYAKGARFHEYLLSVTKEEARKKLVSAGDEGSRTHQAIRQLIGGSKITMSTKFPSELGGGRQEPLNADEWSNLEAFAAFCARYKPRTIGHEFTVYSTIGTGYAGTADYLCLITVPEDDRAFPKEVRGQVVMVMVDWKSSAAIYDEYPAQLAAYDEARAQMGMFTNFVKTYHNRMFTAVVRLGTRHKNGGYEVKVWDFEQTETNAEAFRAAQLIADIVEPTFEPEVEQIPTEFFIKVPKAKVDKPKVAKAKKGKTKRIKEEQGELPLGNNEK